jgi:type IV secretory pathway TrbD component
VSEEEEEMETRMWLILWGSPVGIAVFFAGLGVLLWGVGKLKHAEAAKAEVELMERQFNHERAQGKASPKPPPA